MSVFISGHYNLQDIKFDLLKVMKIHDGYMYNETETQQGYRIVLISQGDSRKHIKFMLSTLLVATKKMQLLLILVYRSQRLTQETKNPRENEV